MNVEKLDELVENGEAYYNPDLCCVEYKGKYYSSSGEEPTGEDYGDGVW